MDTLLVRQYNLIQCFSNPKASGNDLLGDHANSSAMGETDFNKGKSGCIKAWSSQLEILLTPKPCTAGRIESMRSQLNSDNVKNLAETEQIQTLEVRQ